MLSKIREFIQLLLCILFIVNMSFGQPANETDKTAESAPIQEILVNELAGLWPAHSCSGFTTYKSQTPMIVLGCAGNFSETERSLVLDYMFRRNQKFVSEKHDFPHYDTGIYDFTFESIPSTGNLARTTRLRILVKSPEPLYGQPPVKASLALVVENITDSQQITNWNTLGIRLSFAFKPSDEIAQFISLTDQYKQEAWLHLPILLSVLEGEDANVQTEDTAPEKSTLANYIKDAIAAGGETAGVVITDNNSLTTEVSTTRLIVQTIKDSGHTMLLTPLSGGSVLRTTANMMSMATQKSQRIETANCKFPAVKTILHARKMLLQINAQNAVCLKVLKREIPKLKAKGIRFVYASDTFPGNRAQE